VVMSEIRANLDFLPGIGLASDLDERWRRSCRDWRPVDGGDYDWCIFDLPSLEPSIDIRVAGGAMDRLILMTRWGQTTSSALAQALDALGDVRGRIAGAIINMTPRHALSARDSGDVSVMVSPVQKAGGTA
jgi:hypothetical protein